MEIPHIDPVGIVRVPEGYRRQPRSYPWPIRLAAVALLTAFVGVSTVTTVASLGRYCLTSQAGSEAPRPQ